MLTLGLPLIPIETLALPGDPQLCEGSPSIDKSKARFPEVLSKLDITLPLTVSPEESILPPVDCASAKATVNALLPPLPPPLPLTTLSALLLCPVFLDQPTGAEACANIITVPVGISILPAGRLTVLSVPPVLWKVNVPAVKKTSSIYLPSRLQFGV